MNTDHLKLLGYEVVLLQLQPIPQFYKEVERTVLICDHFSLQFVLLLLLRTTSTSTLLTDKTLQHHISIKFISINYKYKKYNIIFQGGKF